MYNKTLILSIIENINDTIEDILGWTKNIQSVDDFFTSDTGMILLNAVCMKLFAIGEEVKSLDKHTEKKLLSNYTSINWSEIMRMRDVIAHHYFEIETDIVFDTIKTDIPKLYEIIKQIKKDITLKI
jgi:uncharacterized protein with HEPN domain